MNLKIKKATPSDAETLAKIHIDSWKAAYHGLVPEEYLNQLNYKKRAERFKISLQTNADDTYVIEKNDLLLGFIIFGNCRDEDLNQNSIGEIWGIYLAPEYWRQGIGTKLFRFGERILLEQGYKTIVLWVFAENTESRKFYEVMGFKADGTSKIINCGKPLTAVRYKKIYK